MYSYLSVTLPPASSISFFKDSASALAIPLSQQRAAVTLCDEKRREEP